MSLPAPVTVVTASGQAEQGSGQEYNVTQHYTATIRQFFLSNGVFNCISIADVMQTVPWASPGNFPGRGTISSQKRFFFHVLRAKCKNGIFANFRLFRTKLWAFIAGPEKNSLADKK